MEKRRILLQEIDPVEILGVNNVLLTQCLKYFPNLKIASRGEELLAEGDTKEINDFEDLLESLITTRHKKRNLSIYDVDSYFEKNNNNTSNTPEEGSGIIVYSHEGKPIVAKTPNQQLLAKEYSQNDLLFAVGPAGTGKTYTAIALAVKALKDREVKRIILTRPAVEAGERLGFLPGDLKEKLDPYLQPLYDALLDILGSRKLQALLEDGTIQIAPLAYMRGRTLGNAFVILDEAQNTNLGQLKMFLTRMGCNSKFIVTGDASQVDLPKKEDSGLLKGIELLKDIKNISVIEFDTRDIVRHPLVSKIVLAFGS